MLQTQYLNAGAGTGKTYRLTHILSDILVPNGKKEAQADPSQVIVATFTCAAADEIRQRARKVLLEAGHSDKASQLDSAAIGTIHAVCQQFLQRYWYVIGACPGQEVITDDDRRIYRNQSLASMLKDPKYATQFKAINDYYHEFLPTKHDDNISQPDPEFWADMLEHIVSRLSYYQISNTAESLQESFAAIDQVFCYADAGHQPTQQKFDAIRNELVTYVTSEWTEGDFLNKVKRLKAEMIFPSLLSLYGCLAKPKGTTAKKWPKDKSYEQEAQTVGRWLRSTTYGKKIKECVSALFTLAQAWQQSYEDFKHSHGVIDFDDMERGFLHLLCDETPQALQAQKEIANQYRLVMVDEFQDCNPIQLQIFDRLSTLIGGRADALHPSSYWVGDPKQAIYSFRGSDTHLIERVARRFPEVTRDADGHKVVPQPDANGLCSDTLDVSYRSRQTLVECANSIFGQEGMFPNMPQLSVNLPEGFWNGCPASVQHWGFGDTKGEDAYTNLARQLRDVVNDGQHRILPKAETDKVAQGQVKTGETLQMRPLTYGDIAILARTRTHVCNIVKALRCEGIPVSSPEADIFDRAETQLLLALLNIANRADKHVRIHAHEHATLLRLWCGESTEEVLRERLQWVARQEQQPDGANDAPKPWLADDSRLSSLHEAIRSIKGLPLDQQTITLIHLLDLNDRVSLWGEATARRQNLQTFQQLATRFVTRCQRLDLKPSMTEFYRYLSETEIKAVKDTSRDSVKVLTYHASKGLEWPMVVLASLDRNETSNSEVFNKRYWGVGEQQISNINPGDLLPHYRLQCFPAPVSSIDNPICQDSGIMDTQYFKDMQRQAREELMRLLYVGVTRARDYLVLFTYKKGSPDNWIQSLRTESPLTIDDFKAVHREFAPLVPKVSTKEPKKENVKAAKIKDAKMPEPLAPDASPKEEKAYSKQLDKYNEALKKNQEEQERYERESKEKEDEYQQALSAYNLEKQKSEDAAKALKAHRDAPWDPSATCSLHQTPGLQPLEKATQQHLNPSTVPASSLPKRSTAPASTVPIPLHEPLSIDRSHTAASFFRNSSFGTCIHNIFAACPFRDDHPDATQREAYLATIQSMLRNGGFETLVTQQSQLLDAILALYRYLTEHYGPASEILHELPFTCKDADGHIITGEIDLLWRTQDADVIIDYKNPEGDPDDVDDSVEPTDTTADIHVKSVYRNQLSLYRHVVAQSGREVKATLLHYVPFGCLVEV